MNGPWNKLLQGCVARARMAFRLEAVRRVRSSRFQVSDQRGVCDCGGCSSAMMGWFAGLPTDFVMSWIKALGGYPMHKMAS